MSISEIPAPPQNGLDVVTFGEVMGMFVAQDPGPLDRAEHFVRALAGAEGNVAVGLGRLGHRVAWIGQVGDDPIGRFAHDELAASGVIADAISVDDAAPTGFQLKSRADGTDPEVAYFRAGSAGSRLRASEQADAWIASARHLHVTGIPLALSPTTREFTLRAIAVAREAGLTISFDPNLRPTLWDSTTEMIRVVTSVAASCDWVLPGLGEGRILLGSPDATAEDIAHCFLDQGAQRVVVKAGSAGAAMHTRAGVILQTAYPVTVVDTVGAGDGFAAGLISASLDGLDDAAALRRAAGVGALATTSSGDKDGLPDRAELDAFLGAFAEKGLADAVADRV